MVDKYRQILEKTYTHRCNIIEQAPQFNSTTFRNEMVDNTTYENQACRISFGSQGVDDNELVTTSKNEVTLFIAPEVKINDSARIIVTINGETIEFAKSSEPFIYPTHKEYKLIYSTRAN